ncbi:putative adaptor protein Cbl domain superfamily [Dioscorea sansibarensis]
MMGDGTKAMLAKPIQLADQVTKFADEAHNFRQECLDLKPKTERLSALLRQAARSDLYERPARRITDDTEQALDKALSLVLKCRPHGLLRRVLTIIPAAAFKRVHTSLDNSIADLSWLLRVSSTSHSDEDDDDIHLGLPPIAQNEPILFLIWEQIAALQTAGSLEARADAAASLASLARDNDRYGKLIVEEDGIYPLLRLVKEGRVEGQENAARAIGLLARDPESIDRMVQAGVCSAFAKVLKDAPMKVQATVAWAVSELAGNCPNSQDVFAQNNVVRFLVGHLAFETVQEHSKYTIQSKVNSIHSAVLANKDTSSGKPPHVPDDSLESGSHGHVVARPTTAAKPSRSNNGSLSGASIKGREYEDPATKNYMKAMAARALSQLAKGNLAISKSITESKALLCFAVLLEKGTEEVRYNCAVALMEIAKVAEQDADLRRSAFKPTTPAAKAVVDQLLRIILSEKPEHDELLVPCIVALGCLSRTFRATETRIIGPLVGFLDDREEVVIKEAAVALTKFACTENYLHHDHSKAILKAGGAKHLIQHVYFGEQGVQMAALILLCYIALHVPDSEELAQAEVLTVLEWASKQAFMVQDPKVEELLHESKGRLELYQSRGSRGLY